MTLRIGLFYFSCAVCAKLFGGGGAKVSHHILYKQLFYEQVANGSNLFIQCQLAGLANMAAGARPFLCPPPTLSSQGFHLIRLIVTIEIRPCLFTVNKSLYYINTKMADLINTTAIRISWG